MLETPISETLLGGTDQVLVALSLLSFLEVHFAFKNKTKPKQIQMWLCSGKMPGSVISVSAELPRVEMPLSWGF